MSMNCCICNNELNSMCTYPLSKKLSKFRICPTCYMNLAHILDDNGTDEESVYFQENIEKNDVDSEVRDYIASIVQAYQGGESLKPDTSSSRAVSEVLITSGFNVEGHKIIEYVDYISSETVLGMGILNSIIANVSNIIGHESDELNDILVKARNNSTSKLKEIAKSNGANAIIGFNIDYTMFGNSMVAVIANGTAVKIEI